MDSLSRRLRKTEQQFVFLSSQNTKAIRQGGLSKVPLVFLTMQKTAVAFVWIFFSL
jgi:hypothetical protein